MALEAALAKTPEPVAMMLVEGVSDQIAVGDARGAPSSRPARPNGSRSLRSAVPAPSAGCSPSTRAGGAATGRAVRRRRGGPDSSWDRILRARGARVHARHRPGGRADPRDSASRGRSPFWTARVTSGPSPPSRSNPRGAAGRPTINCGASSAPAPDASCATLPARNLWEGCPRSQTAVPFRRACGSLARRVAGRIRTGARGGMDEIIAAGARATTTGAGRA